jgi:hypothetical protein
MGRILNLTMNRGEWSEAYALLTLIQSPDFILSDSHLNSTSSQQYKISSILLPTDGVNKFVELSLNGTNVIARFEWQANSIPVVDIKAVAEELFQEIQNSTTTTFSFNKLDSLWDKFFNPKIKATSANKSDIQIKVLDKNTQKESIKGFSIKSNLGSATSLLNASQLTNFLYEVPSSAGLTDSTPKELGKQVKSLSLTHHGSISPTYKSNLAKVDKNLEMLISCLLLEYYGASNREKFIKDLLPFVINKNPLNLPSANSYEKIISTFLKATAFGMVPRVLWDGTLSANGGMIVIKENGELANFYLDDTLSSENLEKYLLENCFFDTASTSRHEFGEIYNITFFKFNLLIRL